MSWVLSRMMAMDQSVKRIDISIFDTITLCGHKVGAPNFDLALHSQATIGVYILDISML